MPAPLFSIETTGYFDDDQVIVRWRVEAARRHDPVLEAFIADEWQRREAAAAKGGHLLFNGPLCRLIEWVVVGDQLRLTLGPTDYRTFLGTNVAGLAMIRQRFPVTWPAYLADPLAVCAVLVSLDGWLLVMRRSEQVAEYPGAYHVIGGHPTPEHDNGLGAISPIQGLLAEIGEETGIAIDEVARLPCLGLIRNQATYKPELVYAAHLTLSRAAIEDRLERLTTQPEAVGWTWLNDDAAAIVAFLDRHAGRVAPAGAAGLTVYARSRSGRR